MPQTISAFRPSHESSIDVSGNHEQRLMRLVPSQHVAQCYVSDVANLTSLQGDIPDNEYAEMLLLHEQQGMSVNDCDAGNPPVSPVDDVADPDSDSSGATVPLPGSIAQSLDLSRAGGQTSVEISVHYNNGSSRITDAAASQMTWTD